MGRFTQLDDSAMAALAEDFALGAIESWRAIEAGTINSNFALQCARGGFFLRVNEGKSEDEVRYEIAVLEHLREQEVETPLPRRARSGERFGRWQDKLISVFDWLPGGHRDSQSIQPADCEELGRTLATLHRAGARAGSELKRESRYSFERIEGLFRSFEGSRDPDLAAAIAVLGEELEWLRVRAGIRAREAQGLIHADLFPDNVLFADGRIRALLDFEQACTGSFLYDLAVCANAWCFDEELVPARAQALLRAYRQHGGIAEQDEELWAIELRAAALRFTITRITDVYLPGLSSGGKDYRRFLMRLRTWQEMAPSR